MMFLRFAAIAVCLLVICVITLCLLDGCMFHFAISDYLSDKVRKALEKKGGSNDGRC